ncbi:unnamed protein product, partial [Allacma fusca]
MHGEGYPSE